MSIFSKVKDVLFGDSFNPNKPQEAVSQGYQEFSGYKNPYAGMGFIPAALIGASPDVARQFEAEQREQQKQNAFNAAQQAMQTGQIDRLQYLSEIGKITGDPSAYLAETSPEKALEMQLRKAQIQRTLNPDSALDVAIKQAQLEKLRRPDDVNFEVVKLPNGDIVAVDPRTGKANMSYDAPDGVLSGGSKFMEDASILSKAAGMPIEQAYSMVKSGLGQGLVIDPETGEVTQMAGFGDQKAALNQKIKIAEKSGEGYGKKLAEYRDDAVMAQENLNIVSQAKDLIDRGIYTGKFADLRLEAAKTLGVSSDDISNTEAFEALMARSVAQNITAFGSGTGLSDADREYAKKMAGGDIKLNKDSLRKILNIGENASKRAIDKYNKEYKNNSMALPVNQSSASGVWSAKEIK